MLTNVITHRPRQVLVAALSVVEVPVVLVVMVMEMVMVMVSDVNVEEGV